MELPPSLYHWLVRPEWFSQKYIIQYLNSNYCFKNKSVLDFGCGIGTNCTNFKPNHYLGVDCDLRRIDFARYKHPEYCFRETEGTHLPVSNGLLDYILILSVLHHIPGEEILEYLREFRRILKPDGKVIVMEPCVSGDLDLRSRLMCLVDRGKYIRNRNEYVGLFEQQGFQARTIESYNQMVLYKKIMIEASPN